MVLLDLHFHLLYLMSKAINLFLFSPLGFSNELPYSIAMYSAFPIFCLNLLFLTLLRG